MFAEVFYHRMKYFLSPQLDLYKNIAQYITVWATKKGYDPRHGPSILDYGCGNGFGTLMLQAASSELWGVDSDVQSIIFAQDVLGHIATFSEEDWSRPDLLVEKFDIIVCMEVLEHVRDAEALVLNFRKSLSEGGLLFISTLNHNSQYRKNECHIGKYCIRDFRALIERHFGSVRITDYTLKGELEDHSTRTPIVAVWRG